MELLAKSGKTIVLKPEVPLDDGDVIDSMFMSKKDAVRLLRRADAGCVRDRRDVLLARQGDHDEGQPPHRLRPRGQDLLQGRLRQAPGAVRRLGRQRQQWLVRSVQQDRVAAGVATRRDHRGPTPLPRTPPRARDGRFGQRYLQLPLAERCDRGRLDARDDSRGRQDVWRRRKAQGHQGGQPGVHLRASIRRSSTSARQMASSIRRRWAPSPMWV